MSDNEKRYRVQIQFDMHSENDKEAVQEVLDLMSEQLRNTVNPNIIWMAENYYASFDNREIDFNEIENEIQEEDNKRIDKIKSDLPF